LVRFALAARRRANVQGSAWDSTDRVADLPGRQSLRSAGTLTAWWCHRLNCQQLALEPFPVASPRVWNSLPASQRLIICTLSVDLAAIFT